MQMQSPEIEVFGHVDLLENIHESLFFRRLFNPVVERNWHDI
jgi:hypothetical protein